MATASLSIAARQMADLIGGGLPLARSLDIAAAQTADRRLREALSAVRADIEAGRPLWSALAARGGWFSPVFVGLIRVGESTGALESAFREISSHLEIERDLARRARQALTYPAIVLVLAVAICVFLSAALVPRFQALFADLGRPLPLPTRLLIGVSEFIRRNGALTLAAGTAFAACAPGARSAAARHLVDWTTSRPAIRRWLAPGFAERWAHLMSTLTRGGFPVSEALHLTRRSLSAHPLSGSLSDIEEAIAGGLPLSRALRRCPFFPWMVAELVAAGEESGRLEGALENAARALARSGDDSRQLAVSLLEPALVLVTALVVGFIAVAMLLPIFDMSASVK